MVSIIYTAYADSNIPSNILKEASGPNRLVLESSATKPAFMTGRLLGVSFVISGTFWFNRCRVERKNQVSALTFGFTFS